MMSKQILDLACGGQKHPGAIGIDHLALPGVDVIHDLNSFPYPFESSYFDGVFSYNGMEHLDNPLQVMAELHRICKPGAKVHIEVPFFASVDYFTDPTHKHPFSTRSFDYIVPGTSLHRLSYFDGISYQKESVRICFWGPPVLHRLFAWLANRWPNTYERRFAFIIPAHQLVFDLEVVK